MRRPDPPGDLVDWCEAELAAARAQLAQLVDRIEALGQLRSRALAHEGWPTLDALMAAAEQRGEMERAELVAVLRRAAA